MKRTILQALDESAKKHASRPALQAKRNGVWQSTTWAEYRQQVRLTARGLMKLGLQVGQGVAIIGYNRPEWLLADLGAIAAAGLPAGIYTTSSPEQCQYIADHCEAAVVVVENAEQLKKLKEIRSQLPRLKAIVMMQGSDSDDDIYSWEDLKKAGEQVPESDLDARIADLKPDDVCTLIYTSGTTGNPKAVMISHENAMWVAQTVVETLGALPDDRLISYLPLSHIAEQVVSIHAPMVSGGSVWFAESMEKLGENLREVHPSIFLGVPRVWEKIQARIQAVGAETKGLRKKIGAWARKKGLEGGYAEQQGRPQPRFYGLAERLVFSKVRAQLGLDQCRLQATTAAPISRDTLEFFLSFGIPICEVYGMSECTGPATYSTLTSYRTGKAGKCLPGAELKVAEDGEICIRGRHVFKGYFKDEEATKSTVDAEGWLHSGDIGEIDHDGFLKITDRKKDIIVTAGGENIAPQMIEGHVTAIELVSQAVVIGDRRKYLSALLTLDPEALGRVAREVSSSANDPESAAKCPQIRAYVEKQIDQINSRLARVQTIKKFAILPTEFSIDGGELTPTMKIKRRVVNQKYADTIQSLYA